MRVFKISGPKIGKIDDSSDGTGTIDESFGHKEILLENTCFITCNTTYIKTTGTKLFPNSDILTEG